MTLIPDGAFLDLRDNPLTIDEQTDFNLKMLRNELDNPAIMAKFAELELKLDRILARLGNDPQNA